MQEGSQQLAEKPRHPAGLMVLFTTEMWERFSFYLMLGILPLYLADSEQGGMGWTDKAAAAVVGTYIALVYLTPFIGGLLADRLFGSRKMIIAGGLLMMAGHIVLAIPNEFGLYAGLAFLILGNGAFKPNISSLLGNLYPPGSPLKDAGYSIFYLGINIGAFICNIVAALVRNYFDEHPLKVTSGWEIGGWHAAFATAGVGMLIGLIIFAFNYRRFAAADPDPRASAANQQSLKPLWVQCLVPAVIVGTIGWLLADREILATISKWLGLHEPFKPLVPFSPPTAAFLGACIPVLVFYLNIWRSVSDPKDRGRVASLLVVYAVVIVFWMIFHLNTTALTVWTRDNTNRDPNAVVRAVTNLSPALSENAPPKYFDNADSLVPRPDRSMFEVVSPERYKQMVEGRELAVKEGEKVFVTQEIFDKIYAKTDAQTPILPPGKHLKLTNTELFQSINPGYVILFTPLLVGVWHFFRLRGWEPTTPAKIGLGLLITSGAPAIMLWATWVSGDGAVKVSAWWLFATYAMATVGELCLSPMGLALVNKMSPRNIQSFMMGGWFLSTSIGNKLSGIFGEAYQEWDHYRFWTVLIASGTVFGLIIFAILPWLKRNMRE